MTEQEYFTSIQIANNLGSRDDWISSMLRFLALECCRGYIYSLETPRPDLEQMLPNSYKRISHI